jgi:hypothetical protein
MNCGYTRTWALRPASALACRAKARHCCMVACCAASAVSACGCITRRLVPGFVPTIGASPVKGRSHRLARVAFDFKVVRTPALIATGHLYLALMQPARVHTPGRLDKQQAVVSHHAIDAFMVNRRQTSGAALPVDQRAGAPVAIAGKLCNVLAYMCKQFLIVHGCTSGAPVNSLIGPGTQAADV